jgi:hypothetical protein
MHDFTASRPDSRESGMVKKRFGTASMVLRSQIQASPVCRCSTSHGTTEGAVGSKLHAIFEIRGSHDSDLKKEKKRGGSPHKEVDADVSP